MGTHSTVAVPSHGSRDVTWCRAELLLSHGTSGLLLATEGAAQTHHGGSHSRKRDVEAGKDASALRKRAKPEPGKSLSWEGAEVPRGCGGHTEGMFYLLSSAAGVSTHHVPGLWGHRAVGRSGCPRVTPLWAGPGRPRVTALHQDRTPECQSLQAPAPPASSHPAPLLPKHHHSRPFRKGPDGLGPSLCQRRVTSSPALHSWSIPALI